MSQYYRDKSQKTAEISILLRNNFRRSKYLGSSLAIDEHFALEVFLKWYALL